MSFRLQWDRWARLHYSHKPMSAQLPSKSRDAETASAPSSSTTDVGTSGAPPADLDRAIDDLIAYLAEAADITPAEAFSAVAQGRVLEVSTRSDKPRPRLAGLNALFRHFVRRS
jgi:hypothetical protein